MDRKTSESATPVSPLTEELIAASLPIGPKELIGCLAGQVTNAAVIQSGADVESYAPWKHLIFSALKGLAVERDGVAVFTCEEESEFMLDFVWLHRDSAGSHVRTALGAEVEWGSNYSSEHCLKELSFDFRKLLCFKAPLKVFIFDCPGRMSETVNEMLHRCLERFTQHVQGECYVLIEFYKSKTKRRYEQRAKIWHVAENGSPPQRVA